MTVMVPRSRSPSSCHAPVPAAPANRRHATAERPAIRAPCPPRARLVPAFRLTAGHAGAEVPDGAVGRNVDDAVDRPWTRSCRGRGAAVAGVGPSPHPRITGLTSVNGESSRYRAPAGRRRLRSGLGLNGPTGREKAPPGCRRAGGSPGTSTVLRARHSSPTSCRRRRARSAPLPGRRSVDSSSSGSRATSTRGLMPWICRCSAIGDAVAGVGGGVRPGVRECLVRVLTWDGTVPDGSGRSRTP